MLKAIDDILFANIFMIFEDAKKDIIYFNIMIIDLII